METQLAPDVTFALVLVVVAFASAVKGALGFGFPLIAVPLAANLIGARTAVVLIAIPVVFGNFLILMRGGGSAEELRRFGGMLAGVVAGTVIGAQLLGRLDPGVVSLIVGISAVLLAVLSWGNLMPPISPKAHRVAGPTVGVAAGVLGGATGIYAPLIAAYVHALQVDKRAFVYWLTAAFFLGGAVQVLSYWRLGLYNWNLVTYAVATFVPVVVGTWLGFWIQDRLPVTLFRRLVLLLVLASGVNLVVRHLH
ncbi:MAG TPA: sulfite exporter TauE/SafE family protein [bacterium]|nr:sulfite exporter TauE/SafE family protein [bacterium]